VSLELELRVPDGVVVQGPIKGLRAADATGQFGLLPNHEPFVTVLEPGVLIFRQEDGRERFAAVDGGVLFSERNHLRIVCREAVVADRLEDVADQAAAMLASRLTEEQAARAEFA
jgi:F-type H+-transporting ATPase subunit epsilon